MRRLYLKTTCAGPAGSFTGEREYGVPDQIPAALADSLVGAGFAEWRGVTERQPAAETATAAAPPGNAAERTEAPGREVPPWTMKTEPADYLERWPDGPKAALARLHLEG